MNSDKLLMIPQQRNFPKKRRDKADRVLAVIALSTLVIAYVIGIFLQDSGVKDSIDKVVPEAGEVVETEPGIFTVHQASKLVGYVAVGEANGYGGPLKVVVVTDVEGAITGLEVASHKETSAFYDRVIRSRLTAQFPGKSFLDSFELGADIDGVTGATYTSKALSDAVHQGNLRIAENELGLEMAKPEPPKIQFGYPEVLLVLLYIAGFVGHRRGFRYKKLLRWMMLLTGLFVLGFWYNIPLTLSRVNSFLLGYWPEWQTHLYWYLLVGGIIFIFTANNKNAYCAWFCPFGAAQECMGVIGGAKWSVPHRFRRYLLWAQRGLAWLAIAVAFIFRNPGISSYEVFGTLFSFTGTTVLFILLAIILLVSLFVRRPWCTFLCPLDSVYSFIRLVRTWILEKWREKKVILEKSSRS